jgi:hypothetical protein
MLTRRSQAALIGWEAISSRLIQAKFQTSHRRITVNIVQCYVPTNDADHAVKEELNKDWHIF